MRRIGTIAAVAATAALAVPAMATAGGSKLFVTSAHENGDGTVGRRTAAGW